VAAGALVELGDARAVEPLITTLRGSIGSVRRAAAWALKKISGKELQDAEAGETWWQAEKKNKP